MDNESTYIIRKAAGGSSHYAEVTVCFATDSDMKDGHVKYIDDLLPEWIDASKKGILCALKIANCSESIKVKSVLGSLSDTRYSTVYVCSAIAALHLLGIQDWYAHFDGHEWVLKN